MKRKYFCIALTAILLIISANAWADNCQCITQNTFIDLIENHRPSVVSINSRSVVMTPYGPFKAPRIGAGFAVQSNGDTLIITNLHVVENSVEDEIIVKTNDGKEFRAEIARVSEQLDLAILVASDNKWVAKVNVPTLVLGDSDAIKDGEWVLTIGSPKGLTGSCARGIVSNRKREFKHPNYEYVNIYVQTDMNINTGNSGGPLLNLKGEVVGMITLLEGLGIGAAIPSNTIAAEIAALQEGSHAPGWLGLVYSELNETFLAAFGHRPDITNGLMINTVDLGSPVIDVLEQGDIITHVNGKQIDGCKHLERLILGLVPGEKAILTVIKPGQEPQDFEITVGEQTTD